MRIRRRFRSGRGLASASCTRQEPCPQLEAAGRRNIGRRGGSAASRRAIGRRRIDRVALSGDGGGPGAGAADLHLR
ncbi:hypothetical protein EVAR_762_1 [Eumeta japonica]|uniref:Uncharacterized protein n=1 Tax=Eumeta variegata TaxID=151549 RepID=A0A4C1SEX5_EUMVA|nr:hypothetical protein EVAR_762_1 [Eumeta japonica]